MDWVECLHEKKQGWWLWIDLKIGEYVIFVESYMLYFVVGSLFGIYAIVWDAVIPPLNQRVMPDFL